MKPRSGRPGRAGGRRATDEDGPVRLSEVLETISERMGVAGPDVLGAIFGRWEHLVGAALAAHVRPVRLRDVTLVVVADHPAWAAQVRHLAPEILARLADACDPATAPERLEVRVRT